jgi:hypothetical protein
MTLTTHSEQPPHTSRSHAPRAARPLTRAARHSGRDAGARAIAPGVLASYVEPGGRAREILARPGHGGSVLVVDRDATTLGDRRLVAHLAADEPPENANLVCRHYLCELPGCSRSRRCRPITAEDLHTAPFAEGYEHEDPECDPIPSAAVELRDRHGHSHRLEVLDTGLSIPELRWCRRWGAVEHGKHAERSQNGPQPESVRDAIARLESYEPVRALTASALTRHREDAAVSVAVLRAELRRVDASRIVLNRELRRAVLDATRSRELSLSEIAFRCGRVKRDGKGNASGETSWLSRRVGIAPESASGEPTPWIHTEVLALIARDGLGISPHEVEL